MLYILQPQTEYYLHKIKDIDSLFLSLLLPLFILPGNTKSIVCAECERAVFNLSTKRGVSLTAPRMKGGHIVTQHADWCGGPHSVTYTQCHIPSSFGMQCRTPVAMLGNGETLWVHWGRRDLEACGCYISRFCPSQGDALSAEVEWERLPPSPLCPPDFSSQLAWQFFPPQTIGTCLFFLPFESDHLPRYMRVRGPMGDDQPDTMWCFSTDTREWQPIIIAG
ncbi:hypothetical protein KIPB_011243 [Kipferlia bialata]|uniref:Uncharacterized protein n=1 Tax=Kipferlia bialata TaxID=797122 RepID=A0A9K3D4F3_9EUKA|nr:hypothetical protein KIPB_011243 [Kipferlia bialata]|eukprot:g11243.t1